MRNRYLLVADIVAIVLCVFGAFILRLDWFFTREPEYTDAFRFYLVAALLAKPPILFAFGLYRRYWRYASVRDLLRVLLAVSAASVALAVIVSFGLLSSGLISFPRSILAIDWLLTAACISGIRLSVRILSESLGRNGPRPARDAAPKRVLIAGAGDAGALVVREMQKNPYLLMQPVGFLDDQAIKTGKRIYEVPVLGPLAILEHVVQTHDIDEVLIAMPRAGGDAIRSVVDACRRVGVASRAVPGMFELLDGGLSVSRVREVDIADLLRRRPIEARPETGLYLQGQTVLVTGAGGSIGSELCRQIGRAQAAGLIVLGHGENSIFEIAQQLRQLHPTLPVHTVIADIRDSDSLAQLFRRHHPTVVFHAAAHKHVPLMEACPAEAVLNNIIGTQRLVSAAVEAGVERFVLISTDKAVAPTSIMGATKRVAEMIVREAAAAGNPRFLAVRFGNVLGSRGSVVPLFKRQIEQGGPITITHPHVRRFFMTIPEAVYLVLKAGGLAQGGELFVLNMGEPVRIVDLAQDLVRLSGLPVEDVPIVYTGLRPGEKLDETLWETDSQVEAVENADVYRVRELASEPAPAALGQAIRALDAAARAHDVLQIHHILSELLPTFASSLGSPRVGGGGAPAPSTPAQAPATRPV